MTTTFVAVSWNVHAFVGADGVRDPERCLAVLAALDADVVALQEVQGRDWLAAAERAGYRVAPQFLGGLTFGNALLTRQPLLGLERLDLSVPGTEARGALVARVTSPVGTLRVVGTHFGLRGAERRLQAARLALGLDRGGPGAPTVLLGDFNDWTLRARQLAPLRAIVGPFTRVPTFPSRRPFLALDRVAWRAEGLHGSVEAVTDRAARRASDHLPLRLSLATHAASTKPVPGGCGTSRADGEKAPG